ncbi:ABC transporter permease [Candidatus Nitrosocosmicus sp. FF01]|uniref:ABC transporter permease n=1 Tax=Candidatus Nitrosocosmicus sp. FF01 TaxID=3397670 RepID=UPI0039ED0608
MKIAVKLISFKFLICLLSALALLYIVYPFASIITFFDPENIISSIQRPELVDAFILSIVTASVSTGIIILFGIPLAYCLSRYNFPGRSILFVVVVIPLVLPPLASGALLLGVFNPSSVLNLWFPEIEFTQSVIGIIVAQTYVASPFMILASLTAFGAIDKSLEDIARILGKKNWKVFIQVSLPLAKRGILIGIVMTWIRAIGELGATLMLAYNPHTISIQIYEDNAIGGLTYAIPSILLSIILSIVLVLVYTHTNQKNRYNKFR